MSGTSVIKGMRAAWGVAALLVWLPSAAEAAQQASISGVVMTTAGRAPTTVRVTVDPRVCGTEIPDEAVVVDAAGRLAHAVVTLTGTRAATTPPPAMVMNQKCRFAPRVQIVRPNSAVKTSSTDAVLHTTTVLAPGGRPLFSVALPVPGLTVTKAVGTAGVSPITCNTHPWMKGWLYVTDEIAAVTGPDGSFSLTGVPPGRYELKVWHEALGTTTREVVLAPGKRVGVEVVLKGSERF